MEEEAVWEICKFWILPNYNAPRMDKVEFERYVNFEFYQTHYITPLNYMCLRDM